MEPCQIIRTSIDPETEQALLVDEDAVVNLENEYGCILLAVLNSASGKLTIPPNRESVLLLGYGANEVPGITIEHGAPTLRGGLYVFGGFDGAGNLPEYRYSIPPAAEPYAPTVNAARTQAALAKLGDTLIAAGGLEFGAPSAPVNDVWILAIDEDGDEVWTRYPDQLWAARHSHALVEHAGALYLIGGLGADRFADVWKSTDGGESWIEIVAEADWVDDITGGAELALRAVSFDGYIYLFIEQQISIAPYLMHVWRSADGETWEEVAAPNFDPRVNFAVCVKGDRMYVSGGAGRPSPGGGALVYFADLWYTEDGETWIEDVNGLPDGEARHSHIMAADDTNDALIVQGGYIHTIGDTLSADLWVYDGADWALSAQPESPERAGAAGLYMTPPEAPEAPVYLFCACEAPLYNDGGAARVEHRHGSWAVQSLKPEN